MLRLIDTFAQPPYTESTICKLGKWGSAVKTGRGPATVIGKVAVSQATLLSCSGRVSFARENTVQKRPSLARGFFIG